MEHHYGLEEIIRRLEDAYAGDTEEQKEARKQDGQYPYIPLTLSHFCSQMDVVSGLLGPYYEDRARKKFVDVGCGIGTKVLIAQSYGPEAHGIECEPRYVEKAKALMSLTGADASKYIHQADATKCGYSMYDVIYFYCPFFNPQFEVKLENHLVKSAKKGAYFLANLKQSPIWDDKKVVRRVWKDCIFRKI